jgi:hypothetical protein
MNQLTPRQYQRISKYIEMLESDNFDSFYNKLSIVDPEDGRDISKEFTITRLRNWVDIESYHDSAQGFLNILEELYQEFKKL